MRPGRRYDYPRTLEGYVTTPSGLRIRDLPPRAGASARERERERERGREGGREGESVGLLLQSLSACCCGA